VRGFLAQIDQQYLLESGNSWFIFPIRMLDDAESAKFRRSL
jgi:hypothetical protein